MSFGIGLGAFAQGLQQGMGVVSNLADMRDRMETRKAEREVRDVTKQAATDAGAARTADIDKALAAGVQPGQEGAAPSWNIGGQTHTDEAAARKAAEGQVGSFYDYYMKTGAPRVVEGFLQAGMPDKAANFQKWLRDENVQRGVRSWAGAVRAAQGGDADGFLKHMRDAYNNEGYMPDGQTVTGSRVLRGQDGGVAGMELTFRNRDGEERTQTFNGSADLFRAGISFMAPEKVMEFGMKELQAARDLRTKLGTEERQFGRQVALEGVRDQYAQRREGRAEDRQQGREARANTESDRRASRNAETALERDNNRSLLRAAEEAAKVKGTRPENARAAIETIRNNRAASDLAFAKLPFDEQIREAARAYTTQREAAGAATGGNPAPTPARGVTVYNPASGGAGVVPR